MTVFPEVIGPADSVIVMCEAVDPDTDTLVYDWITDGRLRVKGALSNEHFLYNTHVESHIFYPEPETIPTDTVWIQCHTRGRKGGDVARVVHIVVRQ